MEVVKRQSNTKYILKGILISLITSIILLFALSAILVYTSISETIIKPAIITITAISILIGSSISNMKIKKGGILNGAIIGIVYLICIYLISGIISLNFSFNSESIITIIVGMLFGIFGGILGVNKK